MRNPLRRRTLTDVIAANLASPAPVPTPRVDLLRAMLEQAEPAPDPDDDLEFLAAFIRDAVTAWHHEHDPGRAVEALCQFETEYRRRLATDQIPWDDRL